MAKFTVPKATTAELETITPDDGELIFNETTNTYVGGDGSTSGGVPLVQGGEANTNSNAGMSSDGAGLVNTKVVVDTPIKRIKAGSNISITENANDVEISSAGGVAVVTTTAELTAAEAIGAIAFINGDSVMGNTLIRQQILRNDSVVRDTTTGAIADSQTLEVSGAGVVNSTIDSYIPTITLASSTTATDGTLFYLANASGIVQKDFIFTLQSAGTSTNGFASVTWGVTTMGTNGVTVNSTNFPVGSQIFRANLQTLDMGNWYGFDGIEWNLFSIT